MSQSPPPDSADPFFALATFLVSSSRGAIEEGVFTASLRLLDAAGRLAALAAEHVDDPFLAELGRLVQADGAAAYMDSAETYVAFLDDTLVKVAAEASRRSGLEQP
jgi:hypothetical protein